MSTRETGNPGAPAKEADSSRQGVNSVEEKLQQKNMELETFVNNLPDMAWIKDRDSQFIIANKAFGEAVAMDPEYLANHTCEVCFGTEAAGKFKEDDREVIEGRAQKTFEEKIVHAKKGEIWLETIKSPILDQAGEVIGTVGVARDITDRKRIEEQLLEAQKMEAIGTLAGGVAHEMNNILTVVLGLSSALQHEVPEHDPTRDDLREISDAAKRGRSLVRNLLGYARKGGSTRTRLSLNQIVEAVETILHRTLPKKIALTKSLDPRLPHVECDRAQLTQVVMNLCLNANDAVRDGGHITISTDQIVIGSDSGAKYPELPPGEYVRLRVVDDGVGMDEETRKRAFDPFFTTKSVGEGTGLGLSMVYGAVKNYGGAVNVHSEVGRGTTVTVLVPAKDPPSVLETPKVPQESPARGSGTVLLVDDEDMIRTATRRMLGSLGYAVLLADGGAEAIRIYRERGSEIDLVLLDLLMPAMDGLECFRLLKEADAKVKVLVCTGHTRGQEVDELVAWGAVGVVRKPYELHELSEAIRSALEEAIPG